MARALASRRDTPSELASFSRRRRWRRRSSDRRERITVSNVVGVDAKLFNVEDVEGVK